MEYWYSWVFLYWCDFHYSWAVGCESCPFFVFSPFDPGWFFFCVVIVSLDYMSFCGKLLFRAISCIIVRCVCFLFGVSGSECILVM